MTIASVVFPIVGPRGAEFGEVWVERMASLDRSTRFAAGHLRPETIDILTDARADEADTHWLDGVLTRFSIRDFHGASYGLALAIADKQVRLGAASATRVVATGEIRAGGRGEVASISGFDAKASLVLEQAGTSGAALTFAFPEADWARAAPATREALAGAKTAGRLILRPVTRIADLADLWTATPAATASATTRRRWTAAAAVGVMLACAAVAGGRWWIGAPERRCEAALGALEKAPGDAERIRAAVDTCAAAARARPGSGRLLFLTGQAHAMNGATRLATAYWARAAAAGDPDGLATYGRSLWADGRGDPGATRRALHLLGRAGDLGSAAALEDMAEIYRDGDGVPRDLPRAERLLARARALQPEPGR